ncbi:hypothetical protein VVDAL7940_00842 [Vibrio vulnificus]|nr:hypothetical protein VVDAL7940_00842 [Vibrio vulnificus]
MSYEVPTIKVPDRYELECMPNYQLSEDLK